MQMKNIKALLLIGLSICLGNSFVVAQGLMDKSTEEVFTVVEDMPIPWFYKTECLETRSSEKQMCYNQKLIEYLGANLEYPTKAYENKTEGMVVIKFVIDKEGYVKDAKAVKSLGDGCDEAALKIVEAMPQWVPGRQRGVPVNVWYTLPVKFQLKQ